MPLFAKAATKKNVQAKLGGAQEIAADIDEAQFVPYAIHYDPFTILTKNGELLQTIKVTGFTHEDITRESPDLRTTIRKAIGDAIHSSDYALWIHTIRRKKDLRPKGQYPKDFSGYMHSSWNERHHWDKGYTNEVYVTVVKEGQGAKLFDPKGFVRGIYPPIDIRYREQQLAEDFDALNETVDRMLGVLQTYGARKLGIVEQEGVFYSQPCSYLGKLITLVDQPWPVPDVDLSQYLTNYEVTFGHNALEVREPDGRRRFGAILTLKEYKELLPEVLDRLLQRPIEFVISQCADFIDTKKALKDFETLNEVYATSGSALREKTHLSEIIAHATGTPVDFCEQQTTIFLLADNLKELEMEVQVAARTFASLGMTLLREDVKMEECYWAQLPANFEFLRRLRTLSSAHLAGFAGLNNFPAGIAGDNHWGAAVTVFRTAADTPYYFNFHIGDLGHTSIVGPLGAGKTVLLNFLVSEAQKFSPRVFYFDHQHASEIFLRSIGGVYHTLESLKLNPLLLEMTPENREFLKIWMGALISDREPDSAQMKIFDRGLDYIASLPLGQKTIHSLGQWLGEAYPDMAPLFAPWMEGGEFCTVFNHAGESLDMSPRVIGFDMTEVASRPALIVPVLSYLLHRTAEEVNGEPAMVVLDEAWKLLDNPMFEGRLTEWLDMLRDNNAMAIVATENVGMAMESRISPLLMEKLATQIYLPDPNPDEAYGLIFNLTDRERKIINSLKSGDRRFLMKRGAEAILATLDLEGMDECLAVLSATPEHLTLMQQAIAQKGDEPEKWIPVFLKALNIPGR